MKHLALMLAAAAMILNPLAIRAGGAAESSQQLTTEDISGPVRPATGGWDQSIGPGPVLPLLKRADMLIVSDLHKLGDEPVRGEVPGIGTLSNSDTVSVVNDGSLTGGSYGQRIIPYGCRKDVCTSEDAEDVSTVSVESIRSSLAASNWAAIERIGGVNTLEFARGSDDTSMSISNGWVGWLDQAVFGVFGREGRPVGQEGPLSSLEVMGFAAGTAKPPPRKSGRATWTGAMVGRSVDPDSGPVWENVIGSVRVTVDFDGGEVAVEFSNITDRYGQPWPIVSMTWSGLPMSSDGSFGDRGIWEGEAIRGRVFGNGSSDVAGVFEGGQLVGSFGTRPGD